LLSGWYFWEAAMAAGLGGGWKWKRLAASPWQPEAEEFNFLPRNLALSAWFGLADCSLQGIAFWITLPL
jgi:hypothetical protein